MMKVSTDLGSAPRPPSNAQVWLVLTFSCSAESPHCPKVHIFIIQIVSLRVYTSAFDAIQQRFL